MYCSKETSIDRFHFVLIAIYILYTFWFQYAVYSIYWLFTVLGVLLLGVTLFKQYHVNFFSNILYVIMFMIVLFCSGVLFSENRELSMDTYSTMFLQLLPMFAIYSYIGIDKQRLTRVFAVISISTALMSISLITRGQVIDTGAIVIGELNSNKFSCYLFLGLIADLYLFNETKSKIYKGLLVLSIIVCTFAQIFAASRRGVIVFAFLLVMYFHSYMYIKYKGKPLYRIATAIVVGVILGMVVVLYSDRFNNLVVIQRLFHNSTIGDQLRASYQKTALSIFLESPIIGRGANAVAIRAGMYSHSLFYELIATSGVIGSVAVLLPLTGQFMRCMRISRYDLDNKFQIQLRIIAWAIVGFLLSGIAVVYIYDPDFYILLGLFASYSHILEADGFEKRYKVVIGKFRLN